MNRSHRRAEAARARKLLRDIGVTTAVDPLTGDEVVPVEAVIKALGLKGDDAETARRSAGHLGAKPTKTEPLQ